MSAARFSAYLFHKGDDIRQLRETFSSIVAGMTIISEIFIITPLRNFNMNDLPEPTNGYYRAEVHIILLEDEHSALEVALWSAFDNAGQGVFFLHQGVKVPEGWDAKLVEASRIDDNLGTVSPLCDFSQIHNLSSKPGMLLKYDVNALNNCLWFNSDRSYIETPVSLHDCIFIPSRLLDNLKRSSKNLGQIVKGPEGFDSWIMENGYIHAMVDFLYVQNTNIPQVVQKQHQVHSECITKFINDHPLAALRVSVEEDLGRL